MDKERLRTFLKGAAIVVAVAALVIIDRSGSLCGSGGPAIGQPAPDFALRTPEGETVVRLSALRGKVVLLDFWATWCGACVRKMPALEKMQTDLRDRGLRVLAINVEGSAELVGRFVRERRIKLRMLLDDGRTADRYGVHRLPHLSLIDRAGRLVHVQRGGASQAELRLRVLAALNQAPPAAAAAPAPPAVEKPPAADVQSQ